MTLQARTVTELIDAHKRGDLNGAPLTHTMGDQHQTRRELLSAGFILPREETVAVVQNPPEKRDKSNEKRAKSSPHKKETTMQQTQENGSKSQHQPPANVDGMTGNAIAAANAAAAALSTAGVKVLVGNEVIKTGGFIVRGGVVVLCAWGIAKAVHSVFGGAPIMISGEVPAA